MSRGIYQIRRGIFQILPRKTVGPSDDVIFLIFIVFVLAVIIVSTVQPTRCTSILPSKDIPVPLTMLRCLKEITRGPIELTIRVRQQSVHISSSPSFWTQKSVGSFCKAIFVSEPEIGLDIRPSWISKLFTSANDTHANT